jgi:hypothetical protein
LPALHPGEITVWWGQVPRQSTVLRINKPALTADHQGRVLIDHID